MPPGFVRTSSALTETELPDIQYINSRSFALVEITIKLRTQHHQSVQLFFICKPTKSCTQLNNTTKVAESILKPSTRMNFGSSCGNIPNGEISDNTASVPHTPEDAPPTRLDEPPPIPRRSPVHGSEPFPRGNLPPNMGETSSRNGSPTVSQSSSSNEIHRHNHNGRDLASNSRINSSRRRR